jgi:hypothetical protein
MAKSLMLESIYAESEGRQTMTIVDIVYTKDDATKERFDALVAAGYPKRHFRIEGFGRLLMYVPPTKLGKLLSAFPINEGATYFRTTHHWRGLRDVGATPTGASA